MEYLHCTIYVTVVSYTLHGQQQEMVAQGGRNEQGEVRQEDWQSLALFGGCGTRRFGRARWPRGWGILCYTDINHPEIVQCTF